MDPEAQLDALLSTPAHDSTPERADDRQSRTQAASATLVPLLDAADRLEPLRMAKPSPEFARALEEQLLARAELLATERTQRREPSAAPEKTLLRGWWGRIPRMPRSPRWAVPAIAALLLFSIGAGTLTAAASALPGSPLFGLHRLEQGVRVQLAGSPLDRGKLHLLYADQALAALRTAARNHDSAAYRDALAIVRQELVAAREALGQLSPGQGYDTLSSALTQRSADAQAALLTALPALDWTDQLSTTQALGELGLGVPRITSAHIEAESRDGRSEWQITLTGTGFQPGVQIVLDGHVLDSQTSLTASGLQCELASPPSGTPSAIGIENPDGTAAMATTLVFTTHNGGDGNNGSGTSPTATPGDGSSSDHHGGQGSGGGDNHGGGTPTPTAEPTSTPGDH